jgi:hypothetical protein
VRRRRWNETPAHAQLVRRHDGKFPWTYLGKPVEKILEPLGLGLDEFIAICDRFTNKKLFLKDARGNLIKDRHGNLTKIKYPEIRKENASCPS